MTKRKSSAGAKRGNGVEAERPRLLVYLPPSLSQHVSRVLASSYEVVACNSCRDAERELSSALFDGVLMDRVHKDGTSSMDFVLAVRRRLPTVAIILYCEPCRALFREVVEFSRAGISEVVLRGADDLRGVMQRTIAAATEAVLRCYAMSVLDPLLSPQLKDVVTICLTARNNRLDVTGLAAALGVTRKTVANWCRSAGAPNAEALIGWGRVLRAARLLEDRGRSVERIAHTLRFGSASGLTNMFRRYLGEGPTAIRENGGVKRVVRKWAEAFQQPRV